MLQFDKRLDNLLRHISNVREDCLLLGERLIERGETDMGKRLIANGLVHDNSKFYGVEWEYLNDGAWPFPENEPHRLEAFRAALRQHVTTNLHHPEAWPGGIEEMDRLYLAEMVIDWKARSNEQGTDLKGWVSEVATKKFRFDRHGTVYKRIEEFADLLLDRKFY